MTTSPMYTFDTPEPIAVDLDVEMGGARMFAESRDTTVVEVRPANASRRADVEAAEKTRVDFAAGRLEVRYPKPRNLRLFVRPGAVEVIIQLPAGSNVQGKCAYGDFEAEGRLGDCSLKTSYGDLHVQDAADLSLQTTAGDIAAGRVTGAADLKTSSGDIRVAETGEHASLKTSAGDIRVERAAAGLGARTAYGDIRVASAVRGDLDLSTSYGDVEVGVAGGAATFLELRTKVGRVRNELVAGGQPSETSESLKVRAATSYGDITIRRA